MPRNSIVFLFLSHFSIKASPFSMGFSISVNDDIISFLKRNDSYLCVLYLYLGHSIKDLKLLVCKDTQFSENETLLHCCHLCKTRSIVSHPLIDACSSADRRVTRPIKVMRQLRFVYTRNADSPTSVNTSA